MKSVDDITRVDFENAKNYLDGSKLTTGFVTKQRLQKLLDDGDISAFELKKITRE